MAGHINVLFVCVENSCRSQMAEAFARIHGDASVTAHSAGSRPSGQVNPRAVHAMLESGYDLGAHTSKGLQAIPQLKYDAVITMGCGDKCPTVDSRRREDWQVLDPKHMSEAKFNQVRDDIEQRVLRLLRKITE